MPRPTASRLLASLETGVESFVAIGDIDIDTPSQPAWSASGPMDVDGLPPELRAGAALVAVAPGGEADELLPLLARLRDVHAEKVVVHIGGVSPVELGGELVALGFEARKSPSEDGLIFAWDPALANRPREWNNSRHWANPENFSRYRW